MHDVIPSVHTSKALFYVMCKTIESCTESALRLHSCRSSHFVFFFVPFVNRMLLFNFQIPTYVVFHFGDLVISYNLGIIIEGGGDCVVVIACCCVSLVDLNIAVHLQCIWNVASHIFITLISPKGQKALEG